MGGRLPTPFLLLPLFLAPAATAGDGEPAPEPCVIPKGPPCITLSDPRLKDRSCRFEEEACITLQWDEYGGGIVIEEAEVTVTPTCGRRDSAATFEQKGREYLGTLQTIPFEVTVVTKPCETKGFVDVKVTKFRPG